MASAETNGRAWPWSAGVGLEAPEVPTAAAEPVPGQPTGRVAPRRFNLNYQLVLYTHSLDIYQGLGSDSPVGSFDVINVSSSIIWSWSRT